MLQIRKGVFETNSSSTHSFTLRKTKNIKIETDKENNLIIEFKENYLGEEEYFGLNSKISYLLLLLINGLELSQDLSVIGEYPIEKIFELNIFKPILNLINEIGYKGIKIKRNLKFLTEDEKKEEFKLKEIIWYVYNFVDSDNFIKDIKELEDKLELSLKEMLTNDEIVLTEIDRNINYDYTYHSKKLWRKNVANKKKCFRDQ